MNAASKDLIVLVADKNIESAVRGLLQRRDSRAIEALDADVFVHPERDPGCLLLGHDFLRAFVGQYAHGLVVFDREGCGREHESRASLEQRVEKELAGSGWGERAAAVAIDPELEVWVWSGSPHVERVLGWHGRAPGLREWLREAGLWPQGEIKPRDPKRALEEALRVVRSPRSSALYREMADKVSLEGCQDAAFQKLRSVLAEWFPSPGGREG